MESAVGHSDLRAAAPKKRGRGQTEDVLGYKSAIVGIAKSFLFTRAFILPRSAFQQEKPNPPANPQDQFTSDEAYTTSTAIALYEEVPTKFHCLLDPKTEPGFSNDFNHEHSDGRSIFLNALRKALPTILTDVNVNSDLLITAKADRGKDTALLDLLKFPNERKHKPAANSNGIKLGLKAITSSSMAATAISLRFVRSADKEWNSKGAVTGINWEDKAHIKTIFRTVHNFVFAGVDTAIQDDPNEDADDVDELNELMRRFELGADGFDDDGPVLLPDLSSRQWFNNPEKGNFHGM
ncbi:hypothetical protein B0H14DRAFT_2569447 [Mycena olivaceomarginata]|nr:hypothetical protein B0H14DRAFT_2569447 [Mycena olivaceomarginata]